MLQVCCVSMEAHVGKIGSLIVFNKVLCWDTPAALFQAVTHVFGATNVEMCFISPHPIAPIKGLIV